MHRILYEILPKKLRILSTCKRFSIHRHAWSMHGGDLVVTHEHVNKYRIAGNFCWCKFSRKYVCTLFSRNESVTLWPHPYQIWPRPIARIPRKLKDKANQDCATMVYFSFCGEAFAITKVSRLHDGAGEKLACWTEGFGTADLKLDNFGAFLTGLLVFCLHSRLSLFCSNHLLGRHYFRARQTVENHTGTNSYGIMMSSIPSWFIFSWFIFSRKQVCPRKLRKFNFPLYSMQIDNSF